MLENHLGLGSMIAETSSGWKAWDVIERSVWTYDG